MLSLESIASRIPSAFAVALMMGALLVAAGQMASGPSSILADADVPEFSEASTPLVSTSTVLSGDFGAWDSAESDAGLIKEVAAVLQSDTYRHWNDDLGTPNSDLARADRPGARRRFGAGPAVLRGLPPKCVIA